jgi:metallo-beta-lactamase class B
MRPALIVIFPALLAAQGNEHIDAAKRIAGTEWAAAANYFCSEAPTPNQPNDPAHDPVRVFDNLYFIGRIGTTTWAITTSDGIILIDAGYADQLDTILLPGLKKAGLDVAKIKYVIVTHGHADHFGGAAYLQQHGAHVALAAADWDVLARSNGKGADPPERDVVLQEGKAITLGGVSVTPVMIPGHTPGAVGLIFPVKDGSQTHIAGLFGGTVLTANRLTPETMEQYLESIQHFRDVTKRMKVDVEVQNHPLMDGLAEKLAKLQARKPGQPNPFVVGEVSYQRFLDVMTECILAERTRRASK